MWLEHSSQYVKTVFPHFLSEGPWDYKNDLCITDAAFQTDVAGNPRWNRYILDAGKWLVDRDGGVANWKGDENSIGRVSFDKSLRIFRDLAGDRRCGHGVGKTYASLEHYPQIATGNFWHKDIYPNQVWLNGLYTAMHFYAECLAENGEDRRDDIMDQFQSTHCLLWNERIGLYLHGCDINRKVDWADPVTSHNSRVWFRAEGWFLIALADIYGLTKDCAPRAEELALLLKSGLDGLLRYQDKEPHMFLQVVDHADLPGNYPEASGSTITAYALMKGARLGVLGGSHWDKGNGVLEGIRRTRLKKGEDGWHLRGIYASAGLGTGPNPHSRKDRNETPKYHISGAQMTDNQHGVTTCMMAVGEQLRRKGNHSCSH